MSSYLQKIPVAAMALLTCILLAAGCAEKSERHANLIEKGVGEKADKIARGVVATTHEDLIKIIEKTGVTDKLVLKAMRKVKRHLFVPENLRGVAYTDYPWPIGEDQTISQPSLVAKMTELLELKGGERVLEIGTGSGYQAAILAEIAKEVYTIEIVPPLAKSAEKRLKELGYKNITVRCGDGYRGWKEKAPFDAIIVTCGAPEILQPLVDQLRDGGIMVSPVGENPADSVLKKITKQGDSIAVKDIFGVGFVPMTGEVQKKKMK
jgi:protein-L-isoaspartate(D-aspartate) O-methyltransferase